MSSAAVSTFAVGQRHVPAPDPRLRIVLWKALWCGAAMVLLVPAARSYSAWVGFLPLWLLGMPASALWALHRFRLPQWPQPRVVRISRRRRGTQARRRSQRGSTAASSPRCLSGAGQG